VTLAIALFIGTRFFFFGVVLALWAVLMMAVMPLAKALKSLHGLPATQERRGAVYGTLALTVAAVLVLLLAVVPVPLRTQAEGVVWLPEQAIVRAGAPGFFRAFETAPETWVEPGTALARSVDPALDAQVRLLQARVDELEASYAAEFVTDRARAEIVRDQLAHERLRCSVPSSARRGCWWRPPAPAASRCSRPPTCPAAICGRARSSASSSARLCLSCAWFSTRPRWRW
jgi:putative peptide zinc metalloprotease protein